MKTDIARRLRKLEDAHRPAEVPVTCIPLTKEAMEVRWEELQRRAALGDPEASWRVGRINFFIERAKERHDESQRTRETT